MVLNIHILSLHFSTSQTIIQHHVIIVTTEILANTLQGYTKLFS